MFHTNLVRYMRIKDMYDNWPEHFCYNKEKPWLNVSKSQMRRIMKNECEPTLRTKMKLSDRLGVELFELTKRDGKEEEKRSIKYNGLLQSDAQNEKPKTPKDFDDFLGAVPALEMWLRVQEKRIFWQRVRFGAIWFFIGVASLAWILFAYVAFTSNL